MSAITLSNSIIPRAVEVAKNGGDNEALSKALGVSVERVGKWLIQGSEDKKKGILSTAAMFYTFVERARPEFQLKKYYVEDSLLDDKIEDQTYKMDEEGKVVGFVKKTSASDSAKKTWLEGNFPEKYSKEATKVNVGISVSDVGVETVSLEQLEVEAEEARKNLSSKIEEMK